MFSPNDVQDNKKFSASNSSAFRNAAWNLRIKQSINQIDWQNDQAFMMDGLV
jgi:hypothetical protein